ncbi:MAG: peptide deformylase [Roseimicrobium sp.]
MILPIVLIGDPILRMKCKPVAMVTEEIHTLAAHMLETMHEAHGVGLAAPQVARGLQLAVIQLPPQDPEKPNTTFVKLDGETIPVDALGPVVFINPQLELRKEKLDGEEGCLSIPGFRADVRRACTIKVTFMALDGATHTIECDGLLARAFQHEFDHLQGILFIDRLSAAAKLGAGRKIKRMQQEWAEDGITHAQQLRADDDDEED